MSDTLTAVVIVTSILLLFAIAYYFAIYKQKDKKGKYVEPVVLQPTNFMVWSEKETELYNKVNRFRHENSLSLLHGNDDCLKLAKERVQYWIDKQYTHQHNLHSQFYGHSQVYKDNVGFVAMGENTSYGYKQSVFEYWRDSNKGHKEMMLKPYWKYCGIAIGTNHLGKQLTCMIYGK